MSPSDTKKPLRDIPRKGCRQVLITLCYVAFRESRKLILSQWQVIQSDDSMWPILKV